MANNNLWIILCVVILVGIIVYFCAGKSSYFNKGTIDNKDVETETKIENFQNIAGNDTTGAFLDNNYNLMQPPDAMVPANYFADLVSDAAVEGYQSQQEGFTSKGLGHAAKQVAGNAKNSMPMERLRSRMTSQELMPRTSENVTPFNTSLAQPNSFKYTTNQPRVQLKSPNWEFGLYNALVGTPNITYNRNIPVISTSQYTRDSVNWAGVFTDQGKALYNKMTGNSYKSMPIMTSGAGQAEGYGGASGETIMDHYV
jgi:hypothetical protein